MGVVMRTLTPNYRLQILCPAQCMVTAAAQVGVDLNLAANVMWRRDVLQYVPGLGPRKVR